MNETRGLWRAKRRDNGEWIEGFLSKTATRFYYCIEYVKQRIMMYAEVDPSTLGECTSLRDRNGKLIFEGDIIKTKKYGKLVGHSNVNGYDIFVVKYEPAMFRLESQNRGFNLVDNGYDKFEVIGNIHDTPELLKGADNENT